MHDNCCVQNRGNGAYCSGEPPGTDGLDPICMREWRKAVWNKIDGRYWKHAFGPYLSDDDGDQLGSMTARPAKTNGVLGCRDDPQPWPAPERYAMRQLKAPSGTGERMKRKRETTMKRLKRNLLLGCLTVFWIGAAAAEEALVDGIHLKPASAVVSVGGTVKLKPVYCVVVDKLGKKQARKSTDKPKKKYADDDLASLVPNASDDDELAPLPALELVCEGDGAYDRYAGDLTPLVAPIDVRWKVDGPGQISGDKKSATYRAPASRPTPNQATAAATLTYDVGREKTILLSNITILDEVKSYIGTFSMHDVSVNSEYRRDLAGSIRWDFEEEYDIGGWREYKGSGKATMKISRTGCGTAANFSDVPVEGRLKVYDDKKYEFLINLVGEQEQTRTCRRPDLDKDLRWEETFSPAGDAMNSSDPCGLSGSYPHYTDILALTFERKGSCSNVRNQFQEGWSFKAVK